jgi:type II secretory pathway pseudopilin PulG
MMIKKIEGFSLVELLVTMSIFILIIVAASGIFIALVNQFKQQSKMAETNIEGIVGLELLRIDLEHAGYGLPWVIPTGVVYNEATAGYNDSPSDPPRAMASGDNVGFNGSDYLVLKSTVVSRSDTAPRWSYITTGNDPKPWGTDDLVSGSDRVIVINPKASETSLRELVVSGGVFFTTYDGANFPAAFSPSRPLETYVIYGVDDRVLRMPFNRADYYISNINVPLRCATGTGVLEKGVIRHSDGALDTPLPLLDCVADMQVAFGVDTTNPADGTVDCYTNDLANVLGPFDAQNVRDRVKEVRVYLLAQEGQFDSFFTLNLAALTTNLNPPIGCGTCIRVGEGNPNNCTGVEPILGQDFDLSAITNWQNHRWRVYTLVVKTENLR